jgi:hypothetical protein
VNDQKRDAFVKLSVALANSASDAGNSNYSAAKIEPPRQPSHA